MQSNGRGQTGVTRRQVLAALGAVGVGTTTFQRAVAAQAKDAAVTADMIRQAEWIAGIELSDDERKAVAGALNGFRKQWEAMRKVKLDNGVPPALHFHPAPGKPPADAPRGTVELT